MENIFSTFFQNGSATVNVELWHIWAFIIIVSGLIVMRSKKGLAIVSLLVPVALGWHASLAMLERSLPASPTAAGVFYLLFGFLILGSVACTFDLDH